LIFRYYNIDIFSFLTNTGYKIVKLEKTIP
jgi:hypothetical protein